MNTLTMTDEQKLRAAYALNLWTVSISQIIDYNDVYVLEQEYDTIMNNLNLENMPKDEALLDVITEILDEITNLRMDAGDRKMMELKYQHQLKNAVWSAVPNVGAIFATDNPVAMAVTLATQVGIGYMNYRRNKAEYDLGYEEAKWQIQKNRMQHLHGLQKQLFETAWHLAETYEFPDEYRLSAKQISQYNQALIEPNLIRRYTKLDAMRSIFSAYPAFWYQLGSTANSIYRSGLFEADKDFQSFYKDSAIECFKKYKQLNTFNLLRHDILTASWALEYLELQDMSDLNNVATAKELISIAEKHSGNALDILELCAFAYLRIQDLENATRLFHYLVNEGYNAAINTQILSGLYIKQMRNSDLAISVAAKVGYKQLPHITDAKYILEIPASHIDLSQWKPAWNREESYDDFIERQKGKQEEDKKRSEEAKKLARTFYQKPILLVYEPKCKEVSEYFLGVLIENREKIDPSLPFPSQCELKEYKSKREEYERKGTHIILLGDSDEAKKLYKTANNGRWDYYKFGMRYVSYGNKTVLLSRALKNKQIDDFVAYAKEISEKHSVKIPAGVKAVKKDFLKDTVGDALRTDPVVGVLTSIVASPLLVAGEVVENVGNTVQSIENLTKKKDLNFAQYCIAIYDYLKSKSALLD